MYHTHHSFPLKIICICTLKFNFSEQFCKTNLFSLHFYTKERANDLFVRIYVSGVVWLRGPLDITKFNRHLQIGLF